MPNIYRYKFHRKCPSDGALIEYRIEITTDQMVMAERLVRHCDHEAPIFHEALADELAMDLPGVQRMVATHNGVEVETIRRGDT